MTSCVDSSTAVPATLSLSSGDTQTCFDLNATTDNILENDEKLNITVTTEVSDVTLDPDTVVVTIMDASGIRALQDHHDNIIL